MKSTRPKRPCRAAPPQPPPLNVACYAFRTEGERQPAPACALRLARELAAYGVAVHLFTDEADAGDPPGIAVHRIHADADGAGAVARARALCAAAVEHFARVDQAHGPFHLAHAVQWSAAPAALSGRRRGAPRAVVSFLDTVFGREGHCNGDAAAAQVRRLEQRAAADADLVLAGSEPVRQELAWLYGAGAPRVEVVPAEPAEGAEPVEAPEVARVRAGIPPGVPVVAFAGAWTPAAGCDLFLGAASWMVEGGSDARFVVPGDAGPRVRVEADILRRGLRDRVVLAPEGLSHADVCAAADVVVVPAREASPCAPVYAAWRAARPVVVARAGPAHLVRAGRNGALCFPFARSVGETVLAMLSSPAHAARWGAAGRRDLEETFTWSAAASKVNALYRAMASRPVAGTETQYVA